MADETTEKRGPTVYVVLRLDEFAVPGEDPSERGQVELVKAWREVARKEAGSAAAAVRAFTGTSITEGTFNAVPERSWKPKTLATETQVKIIFT